MFERYRANPRTIDSRFGQDGALSLGDPSHGELVRDDRSLCRVHERDEITETTLFVVVAMAEPAPHAQIARQRLTQCAH